MLVGLHLHVEAAALERRRAEALGALRPRAPDERQLVGLGRTLAEDPVAEPPRERGDSFCL